MIRLLRPSPPVRNGMKPIQQTITVPYAFPVAFTRDLFGAGDEALSRFLAETGPLLPHPMLIYVDDGLARAWPGLERVMGNWASAHPDLVELRSPPIRVPR